MWHLRFYLHFLVLFFNINTCLPLTTLAQGFDAFLYQPVTANVTCGTPPEQYYNTKEGYVAPRSRVKSTCDANDPLLSHPPSYMTDGNISTSWQSTNNIDKAYITVNLPQAMYGKQVLFKFGDYRRPGQIAIYKSANFGKTFQAWHYMVSHRRECTTIFGIPESEIYVIPDEYNNRVLCQTYQNFPREYGEEILIDLNGAIRGDGSYINDSPGLLQWMNVTNVHIRFSGLYRKFDFMDTSWHHYVVNELSLIARCDCNGHGDGITCPLDVTTGRRRCICEDNTCGDHCEKCCPAYNQFPWKRGTRAAWISDESTACEECNCLGHSSECRYDPIVAQQSKSLNKDGIYKGGGVCLNCKHNTAGYNCEKCKKFFYRPANVDPTSVDACPACSCHPAGARKAFGDVEFLECVRDEESAKFFPGKKVGDCFCKDYVVGSKCDTCKDEYFRLEAKNPLGCQPCSCFLPGTVQRLNHCHKDFFGQCPCKQNVKMRDCSVCKDGYYDLRNDDALGCKWCDCDVGASISPYVCDKTTGVCTCRGHILGRRCKQIEPGYYFPHMHYICGERNLYEAPKSALKTTIKIPASSMYRLYLQYIMDIPQLQPIVTLKMKRANTNQALFHPNNPIAQPVSCKGKCQVPFRQDQTETPYFLTAGSYEVECTASLSNSRFFLEKLIAIPVEFLAASILLEVTRKKFLSSCDVVNDDMKIGTVNESICLAGAYSMTIKFEDGALPCNCHPLGSNSSHCQRYGGQCECKYGVGSRNCAICQPTFYGFTSRGCKPCNCKGANKICNPETGECICPPNTQGRVCDPCECNGNSNRCNRDGTCTRCQFNTEGTKCEKCKEGYYGDALKSQCTACNCNLIGSYNMSCDLTSGQCFCRPGVVGRTCSQCAPNYFGLSLSGCTECGCNKFGSTSLQCSNVGQCPCNTTAEGEKCNKCKSGFYGLPKMSCLACNCNDTGSILNTNCNNDEFGQCLCKSGVEGRACDRCMKQFAEFGVNGCKQCPLCTRKLQGYADDVAHLLMLVKHDLNLTDSLIALQTNLKNTRMELQEVELNAALFEYRLKQGQSDYTYLYQKKLIPFNSHLTKLISQINMVSLQAQSLQSLAASSKVKMNIYYDEAVMAAKHSQEVDREAANTFTQLVELNSLATSIVGMAYVYVQNIPSFNFDQFEKTIDDDLALSNKVLGNVTDIFKEVKYQETIAKAFAVQMDTTEGYFQTKEKEWAANTAAFLEKIHEVYKTGEDVVHLLNETKKLIESQQSFIDSTAMHQKEVQEVLMASETLYLDTLALYEENKLHTQTVTGGVEIMFQQYSRLNSILRLNVIRGYHLVPRDIPFLKSDPYFKLSIHPRWFNQGPLESSPKYGTLDPTWDWPVGGVYTFFLTYEQMKVTKLVVSIYDYDATNKHEFMGEVVIDLNEMLPKLQVGMTQDTYPLKPQGYASRWDEAFPGPGENSLLDLQNMLKTQITTVEELLSQATIAHSKAEINANQLLAESRLLESTFEQAKRYASKAVNAVNAYNEVYRLINSSLDGAIAVNASVQQITQILSGISVNSFASQTNAELLAAQQFLAQTKERNISFTYLVIQMRSETFGNPGAQSPPRSSILINGIEYQPNLNGHSIVLLDYKTGRIKDVKNFRTDFDSGAGFQMQMYLQGIAGGTIVIIVKQGEGEVHPDYQGNVMERLLGLGGRTPFFTGRKGSFILLGYKPHGLETVPWRAQNIRSEGEGISLLSRTIQLEATLHHLLYTANTTFHAALPQWNEIDIIFPQLKASVITLMQEAATANVIEAALESANIIISHAVTAASQVLRETQNLLNNVNSLTEKYNYLLSASSNITNVIAEGQAKANSAEEKVKFQTNNILQANNIADGFKTTNLNMDTKLNSMKIKLNDLQVLTTKFPFTARFDKNAYSIYTLKGKGNIAFKTHFDIVQFDVKPTSTDGIMWALLSSPDTKTNSMIIYVKDGYVYFSYNLGQQDIVGRNLIQLKVENWYHIHVSRIGASSFLVIQDPAGFSRTTRIVSSNSNEQTHMTFDGKTRWYLNGFPQGIMDDYTEMHGRFSGTFDNVIVNAQRYNLFDSQHLSGSIAYANYRFKLPPTTDGRWITLFGNGFIRQKVGPFSVSNVQSQVELEFRCLKDDVVIFGVTGQSSSFVYGLYIMGGKLMFQFATSTGSNTAVVTERSIYNNGEWYHVKVARSGVNATFHVTPLKEENKYLAESKNTFIGDTSIPEGTFIVFGAVSPSSTIRPPVTGTFAGDLRNVKLLEDGVMVNRSFNDPRYFQQKKGETYYDFIKGPIMKGIRFYGYMWWRKLGSYATLRSFESINIGSIYVSMKTNQKSGVILHKPASSGDLMFHMSLVGGNLMIILNYGNEAASVNPYVTKNLTLSDGQWHNISIIQSNSGIRVTVDRIILYQGWFGNNEGVMIGKGVVHIGGVPPTVEILSTSQLSLRMDVESFLINMQELDFFSGVTSGVSHAGITPGTDLIVPPPSCVTVFPELVFEEDPMQVRFGAPPWSNVQSYLAFNLPQNVLKKYFENSFVITLSFRANMDDGIVFYIANSEVNPTQYVSLEMVDGRLRYEFFSGSANVTIETGKSIKYSASGKWYKVYLLRIYQFGAMLIPETMEYKNARHEMKVVPMSLTTPLYVGGIPSYVNARSFKKRKYGFNGCIRKFEISSGFDTYAIDFQKSSSGGRSTGTSACYSNVEPGISFNGKTSWLYYDDQFTLEKEFSLELHFRTNKRNGLLFYLFSQQTSNGIAPDQIGRYALLELKDGKIQFHYKTSALYPKRTFEWIDEKTNSNESFYLCNQRWHSVKVVRPRGSNSISIQVDNLSNVGGGPIFDTGDHEITGRAYLGGLPGRATWTEFYEGCMKIITLGSTMKKVHEAANGNEVVFACPTL